MRPHRLPRIADLVHRAFPLGSLVESFDREKERVVHEALTAQKLNIFAHHRPQQTLIDSGLCREIWIGVRSHEEIDVFERCARFGHSFDFPVDQAAFQVKYVVESVGVLQAHSVFHQHNVHRVHFAHLDRKDAENFGQQAPRCLLVML